MKLAYIHWADAQGDHGMSSPDDLESMSTLSVETVGFLISEDDEVVRLTGDILHFDGPLKYRDTNVIPKVYIREMNTIEIEVEGVRV